MKIRIAKTIIMKITIEIRIEITIPITITMKTTIPITITMNITIISPAEPPSVADPSTHKLPAEAQVEIQSHENSLLNIMYSIRIQHSEVMKNHC